MTQIRKFRPEKQPPPRGYSDFQIPEGLPLDIEIGCGVGLHPIQYALKNNDRYLVAIEHTREKFGKFQRSLAALDRELPNLAPIHANAISWISHFIPAESVDRYILLYPNPYPRPKDRGRRWYAMPFFSKILETLKPGGTLHLATNVPSYFEEASSIFETYWGLRATEAGRLQPRNSSNMEFRSHFEKKYLERGDDCWDGTFMKPKSSL